MLDLRGNTGGYFPGGVDVARLLLAGLFLLVMGRDMNPELVKALQMMRNGAAPHTAGHAARRS